MGSVNACNWSQPNRAPGQYYCDSEQLDVIRAQGGGQWKYYLVTPITVFMPWDPEAGGAGGPFGSVFEWNGMVAKQDRYSACPQHVSNRALLGRRTLQFSVRVSGTLSGSGENFTLPSCC